jgi:hypothetical protein
VGVPAPHAQLGFQSSGVSKFSREEVATRVSHGGMSTCVNHAPYIYRAC